jgi:uncharacterized membrane protein
MIDTKEFLGIVSAIFVLIGIFPYLRDIHFKRVQPHVLSWIGWTFITALGASAMLADGVTWAATFIFANTFLCLLLAIYATFKKVGVWTTGTYDYLFFGLGVLGLILWQVFDLPILALICAILADLFFGLPTVIKTYKRSASETPFVWVTAVSSALLGLLAAKDFNFSEIAYPLFLFFYDSTILLLSLRTMRHEKSH